jgi:hypothetical protein
VGAKTLDRGAAKNFSRRISAQFRAGNLTSINQFFLRASIIEPLGHGRC